jgi:hypothetical protein
MKRITLQNGRPLVKKQFLNLSNRMIPAIIRMRNPIHHTRLLPAIAFDFQRIPRSPA